MVKVTCKNVVLGIPEKHSALISKGQWGLELAVSGAFQCSQEGPVATRELEWQKDTKKLNIIVPFGSKWLPGLRWTDLELFFRTSASILAAASVTSHFLPSGIHMPAGATGLSWSGFLGCPEELPSGPAHEGASLLLMSSLSSLSHRAGLLFPLKGFPEPPYDHPFPSHTVSPLLSRCTSVLLCLWLVLL